MKTGAMKQVSQEVIPQYAADYMFITDYNPNGESKTFERLKDSSVWKNLDAVKTIVSLSTISTPSILMTRLPSANRWISSPTC